MSIKVPKSPQVEFPVSKFPTDIANVAVRDASCALESQILDFQAAHVERRFRLPPNLAMIIAGHAFANGAGRL